MDGELAGPFLMFIYEGASVLYHFYFAGWWINRLIFVFHGSVGFG